MAKLYCVNPYRTQGVNYQPGDEIEGSDDYIAWLLRDCPSCFSRKKPTKRQQTEGEDRMMKSAPNRGDRGGGPTMTSGNMPGVSRKSNS